MLLLLCSTVSYGEIEIADFVLSRCYVQCSFFGFCSVWVGIHSWEVEGGWEIWEDVKMLWDVRDVADEKKEGLRASSSCWVWRRCLPLDTRLEKNTSFSAKNSSFILSQYVTRSRFYSDSSSPTVCFCSFTLSLIHRYFVRFFGVDFECGRFGCLKASWRLG